MGRTLEEEPPPPVAPPGVVAEEGCRRRGWDEIVLPSSVTPWAAGRRHTVRGRRPDTSGRCTIVAVKLDPSARFASDPLPWLDLTGVATSIALWQYFL